MARDIIVIRICGNIIHTRAIKDDTSCNSNGNIIRVEIIKDNIGREIGIN